MHVAPAPDRTDFARRVLGGLSAIDQPRPGDTDLCLELGLSLWMRQTSTDLDDARPAMLAMRSAVLEASGLERAGEPVPLCGVDPRLDVLNLGAHLRWLIGRATARAQCDAAQLVERALDHMRGARFSSGTTAMAHA